MLRRVIPTLLLQQDSLVKTRKFKDPVYIGDPINAIKIFNEKLADEIIVLDIMSSREGTPIQYDLLKEMASECFMPLCYGGGVRDVGTIRKVLQAGVERVAITTALAIDPGFIAKASGIFGSSTLVGGIDYKKDIFGKNRVYINGGREKTGWDPAGLAIEVAAAGVGEILLQHIERDGTMDGYDLEMLKKVADTVDIPVIISGGARNVQDLHAAFASGAGAAAAGSMFVFKGGRGAILISYPGQEEMSMILK